MLIANYLLDIQRDSDRRGCASDSASLCLLRCFCFRLCLSIILSVLPPCLSVSNTLLSQLLSILQMLLSSPVLCLSVLTFVFATVCSGFHVFLFHELLVSRSISILIFRCAAVSLYEVVSVRPSVRRSVCPALFSKVKSTHTRRILCRVSGLVFFDFRVSQSTK